MGFNLNENHFSSTQSEYYFAAVLFSYKVPDSLDTTNYRRRAEDDSDDVDEDTFSSVARVGGSLVDFGKTNKDHDLNKDEASQETRGESDSDRNNDDGK